MLRVKLETLGDDWKPAKWKDFSTDFERNLVRLLGAWTQRLVEEAKDLAPRDKGKLRASINAQVVHRAGHFLGIVGTNTKYGPYQEFGTGIHSVYPGAPKVPIRPKNGKALKIPIGTFGSIRSLPGNAQAASAVGPSAVMGFIFRGSVKGVKPQPFLTPLLDRFGPEIERDIERLCVRYGFR